MEFNKAYNRQEFVGFLKNRFLPEDFVQTEERGCVKSTCPRLLTLYNDQSPDFPKPGLCYVKDFLYLCT